MQGLFIYWNNNYLLPIYSGTILTAQQIFDSMGLAKTSEIDRKLSVV